MKDDELSCVFGWTIPLSVKEIYTYAFGRWFSRKLTIDLFYNGYSFLNHYFCFEI